MTSAFKHTGSSLLLNLFGFAVAVTLVIALSYLEQISMIVFIAAFFCCLFIFGIFAARILLNECFSRRPWKEASALEGIALVAGMALNYAVLATGTAYFGADDITIIALSGLTGGLALITGGWLYTVNNNLQHTGRFYLGVILWQSLSGILAMGFAACLFWTWGWLV